MCRSVLYFFDLCLVNFNEFYILLYLIIFIIFDVFLSRFIVVMDLLFLSNLYFFLGGGIFIVF